MEGRVPKMWGILNITHNQYLELSMKLDLRNNGLRARDWTEFAEWTGSSFFFYYDNCVPVWIYMHSNNYIGYHSITIPLLYNFTANNKQELVYKKNNPILQCNFHLKIMKWICFLKVWSLFCYVSKETWGLNFFFFVISNRNQKDLGNRINPAFLLHKENGHHGYSILPLVFPGSTQKACACMQPRHVKNHSSEHGKTWLNPSDSKQL